MAITIPSFYYGTLFAWSVGITIIAPQLYEAPPYGFKPIPTGCTYLGLGVGAILGKWVCPAGTLDSIHEMLIGFVSVWRNRGRRRRHSNHQEKGRRPTTRIQTIRLAAHPSVHDHRIVDLWNHFPEQDPLDR